MRGDYDCARCGAPVKIPLPDGRGGGYPNRTLSEFIGCPKCMRREDAP